MTAAAFLSRLLFGTALLASVSQASAGTFTMNSAAAEPGDTVSVVIAFAGDGITQDAQWDLRFDPSVVLISASTVLIPGSICAFSNELGLLRAVPPSGEGAAVPSETIEYCRFDLTVSATAPPIAHAFTLSHLECTPSHFSNPQPCIGVPGAIVVVDGPKAAVDPAPGPRLITDRIDGAATSDLVTIRNVGTEDLTLAVDAPSAPFSAALSAQSLAPGATATLTVACDATAEGYVPSPITLRTNDSGEPTLSWAYRCFGGDSPEVRTVPGPGPRSISDPVDASRTSSTTTIFNLGSADLTLSVDYPLDPFSATLSTTTVAPGGSATLTVTCFATSLTPRFLSVRVATNDLDEPLLVYDYSCVGALGPEVSTFPLPGHMIISDPVDGASTTGTIHIHNEGTANLSLAEGALAPPFTLALSSTSLPAAASATLTVGCNAVAAGPVTTSIVLATNDADEPSLTFTVTCTGSVGPTPEVVADITRRLIFGTQTRFNQIQNVGSAPLTLSIRSYVVTAVLSSQTLAPGESATVAATCDLPEGATARAGAVIVTTNDIDEPTLRFNYDCYPPSPVGTAPSAGQSGPLPDLIILAAPLPVATLGNGSLILLATSMMGLGVLGLALRRRAPIRLRILRK